MDECNEKDRYNLGYVISPDGKITYKLPDYYTPGPGFSGFNSYYNEKMKSMGESKIVCQVSKDKIKKE